MAVSISLHAEAFLSTNNKFGLFFSLMSIYIQKIKVECQYFQEIWQLKNIQIQEHFGIYAVMLAQK